MGPVKAKKIGLLGNMNNNNFAIMRYLRDLGWMRIYCYYQMMGKAPYLIFLRRLIQQI